MKMPPLIDRDPKQVAKIAVENHAMPAFTYKAGAVGGKARLGDS
jgi:hypothetical protein